MEQWRRAGTWRNVRGVEPYHTKVTTKMQPTHIFLLAGQSNMVGSGVTAEVPERWRTAPANLRLFIDERPSPWLDGDRFGPEVGFGIELVTAMPDTPTVLCKVARSGANLYYDWNPDGVSRGDEDVYRGPVYPALLAAVDAVSKQVREQGETPLIAGMLWMQGERDSVIEVMANAYDANLRAFILQVREDLGNTDLPFLMGQIGPRIIELPDLEYRHAFRDTVREAQTAVAESMPDVALIGTDDLPQSDNLHFTTAGLLELGRRYAVTYLQRFPMERR